MGLRSLRAQLNTQLLKQQSEIWNVSEQGKLELALEKEKIEESNFWSDLIDKISHPETIDYSFLKKYGIIFLVFFLALWYFSKSR